MEIHFGDKIRNQEDLLMHGHGEWGKETIKDDCQVSSLSYCVDIGAS